MSVSDGEMNDMFVSTVQCLVLELLDHEKGEDGTCNDEEQTENDDNTCW